MKIISSFPPVSPLKPQNIQSVFAEAFVHLSLPSVALRCPAVVPEQVVRRRFRDAWEICAQALGSAASPVKSGFLGMENSVLV